MDNLKRFETQAQYEAATLSYPNVSWITSGDTLHYVKELPPHDYSQDYLTFVAQESGTFTFEPQNSNVISYSTDDGSTWTEGNSVNVNANDKVLWKGTDFDSGDDGIGKFSSSNAFTVEGNTHSLLWGDNFVGETDLSGKDNAFSRLFEGCTTLTSAENMILPATTLVNNCYSNMFSECGSLTTAPSVLPATTLVNNCYSSMFMECTSLTTAPQLLATTLAQSCYGNMFDGCTSLTTAPILPATTLADWCYEGMFNGCTSLSSITCLATDISASSCTGYWVDNVAASGTFTKAASMTSWASGADGIPSGWTVQDYQE